MSRAIPECRSRRRRPRRAALLAALAGGSALCFAPAVRGADEAPPYELSYQGAPGCPNEAAFRADTLSHVHDGSAAAGARIAVRIDATASGYAGELVATDEGGTVGRRTLEGGKCADVAHALAFLAGLAIELGGRLEREEPPPEAPKPAPPPPPTPAPPRPPVTLPPRNRGARAALSAVLLGEVRTGLAASVRPGVELGADVESRRRELSSPALRLTVLGSVSELSGAAGSATLRYLASRVEACPIRFGTDGPGAISLRPCADVEVGYVRAESHAAENPKNGGEWWPSGGVDVRLKWRIFGGLFLESDVTAAIPFIRPKYYFVPDRILYEVPSVTVRAAAGVGYRF